MGVVGIPGLNSWGGGLLLDVHSIHGGGLLLDVHSLRDFMSVSCPLFLYA